MGVAGRPSAPTPLLRAQEQVQRLAELDRQRRDRIEPEPEPPRPVPMAEAVATVTRLFSGTVVVEDWEQRRPELWVNRLTGQTRHDVPPGARPAM